MTTQLPSPATGTPRRPLSAVAGAGMVLAPLILLVGIAVSTFGASSGADSPDPAGPPSSAEVLATQR